MQHLSGDGERKEGRSGGREGEGGGGRGERGKEGKERERERERGKEKGREREKTPYKSVWLQKECLIQMAKWCAGYQSLLYGSGGKRSSPESFKGKKGRHKEKERQREKRIWREA